MSDAQQSTIADHERSRLRREHKQQRASLTRQQQNNHAQQAAQHFPIASLPAEKHLHIALYSACNGELATSPLAERLEQTLANRCTLYWPIITGQTLKFGVINSAASQPNAFGIPQPTTPESEQKSASDMDVIVLPLTAADKAGNRLGMGGGFYDRSLADCEGRSPLLIGYAHSFQQVAKLAAQPWDKKLHGLVTEQGCHWFR